MPADMSKKVLCILFLLIPLLLSSQEVYFNTFMTDSSMENGSVTLYITDPESHESIFDSNSGKSLVPASVLKLITTAAAIELLGPDYTFKTAIGYTGVLNKRSGKLNGDIVIKGGGDPSLGSKNFEDYYAGFIDNWISEIKKIGIRKVNGRVITDDSYYDYQPVPAKWLWEDAGNYYGAGAYGLSVFDNTYEIHFKTSSDSSTSFLTGISPEECRSEFSNWLIAAGTADKGYVFAAPYSTNGWLAGTIPANVDDFILKASIADPPLIMAKIIDHKLKASGIDISRSPTTTRLLQSLIKSEFLPITETISPRLEKIIEVLNHNSVNLYAEHLVKEMGKVFKMKGSTESGVAVIYEFLASAGVRTDGMFLEDGSGVSPLDAVNARGITDLLVFMKNKGKFYNEFYSSLPDAGKEGTLKNYFRDPLFDSRMKAKSGSMTRVRSYAGYLKTLSDKELVFCIIVNNYSGSAQKIVSGIEEILKETILHK
jgi:serine-type D-Ala-D-Ala carboxypeptidase/endopeptidase (penicillin-binding protein 4)